MTTAAATSATTTSPPPPRIVIRSPRKDAHTGQNLTVRVALLGTAPPSSSFRYVLDGRFTRHGSTHVTFTDLAPGSHHLVVTLVGDSGVRAADSFIVRAPPPPPPPATTSIVAPTTSTATSTPTPNSAPASPPAASNPPPTPSPSPPASHGGIPQGNGGDMDADNNGGPSDGDGNV